MSSILGVPELDIPEPPTGTPNWMANTIRSIKRALRMIPFKPLPQVYLLSPNGTVYRVSVDNTGTLVVAQGSKDDPRPPL